jgi:lambda family phage portal protein
MGILRTFLRDFGYIHRTDMKRRGSRAYEAAKAGRLTADWLSGATSIDHDIRMGLVATRSRARDLSQNNEYAKAYLRAVRKNIVGSEGFKLQVKAVSYEDGKPVPDRIANSKIENAFWDWSQPDTATVTGKTSFRKVQELIVETTARDGDFFVRLVRNRNINKYGFSLQLVEPDWIDEKLNKDLTGGNMIRMGVELDSWRRPLAYHVSERNPSAELWGSVIPSGPYRRIPASDMIHVFDPERADQTRGISWMAPGMLGLHNLKGYVEAAIINARAGANKLGFFRDPTNSGEEYTGDTTDGSGNKIATCEPGMFEDIGQKEFHPYDPKYPDEQFDSFVKTILRGIGSGLGLAYSSIANDQREATWSSLRTELGEEREGWKMLQSWFIETFLNRVYSEWLYMAIMTEAINLPFAKYDKFNAPKWIGRRWYWVDPLKEVQANKEAIAANLMSATQVVSENGGDIEELYQEIEQEQILAAEHGLIPDYGGNSVEPAADGDGDDMAAVKPAGKNKGNGKGVAANA